MFDSSMSAAAIAARIQELQAAAGIKAQLVNPSGRGAGIITLTGWVALAALVSPPSLQHHVCANASSWSSQVLRLRRQHHRAHRLGCPGCPGAPQTHHASCFEP